MKTPDQILQDVADGNDNETRNKRRNRLNALRARVDEWLGLLDARRTGPSAKEMVSIVADLESHIKKLRRLT